jgi:predicted metal-dependent HD superfamily phosphohydrolase
MLMPPLPSLPCLAVMECSAVLAFFSTGCRQKFFPYLMAFYTPNDKVTAAEWMHAMLKYGQYRQQEVESSEQAAQTVQALQQYSRISQALALLLLQQWHQEADSSSRRQLVLPDAGTVDNMLSGHQEKQQKK